MMVAYCRNVVYTCHRMVLFTVDWIQCFRKYHREYRAHAVQKMVERGISFVEIDEASDNLRIVNEYENDSPYPSCLAQGFTKRDRPLHMVFAVNHLIQTAYIITVYEPERARWTDNFTRRIE